jgi:hypothetical protein
MGGSSNGSGESEDVAAVAGQSEHVAAVAGESLEDVATFLSGVEAFKTLSREQLLRVAASVTHLRLPPARP